MTEKIDYLENSDYLKQVNMAKHRKQKIGWIFLFMLLNTTFVFAQKEERQNLRSGNKHYDKNEYSKAEVDYRNALEVNSKSVKSYYNLGNSMYRQFKPEKNKEVTEEEKQRMAETVDSYKAVTNLADKNIKAMAWHNIGNVFMLTGDYEHSVEAYKNSLLNNPNDHETRYNYILAKELLKNQQNQQSQNQPQNQDNQEQQQGQNKNQNQQTQNQQNQQSQNQPQNRMSQDNAEQILNAIKQQEQETQEKRKQTQPQQHRNHPDKDW